MQLKQVALFGLARERVDAGISPHIASVPAEAAELHVIAVRAGAGFEHEDELVLAAVQRAHPRIVLDPDAQIQKFGIDFAAGGEHLFHVPPIHKGVEQSAAKAESGLVSETA